MAKNQAIGVSASAIRQYVKDVSGELQNLNTNLENLRKHVEEMNRTTWYGGDKATKWYKNVQTSYKKNVDYAKAVSNFVQTLEVYGSDLKF